MLVQEVFCGCTVDQLANEIRDNGPVHVLSQYDDYVKDLRTHHTLKLQKIHSTGPDCPNPKLYESDTEIGKWKEI